MTRLSAGGAPPSLEKLVVSESRTLEWFAARVDTIELRCNAHRDMRTTVARHLLDRERRGEQIMFDSDEARQHCVHSDMLWELSIRHQDGGQVHVAAPGSRIASRCCKESTGWLWRTPSPPEI